MSWLVAIFVLGLLVVVHEAGHFFVARASGVRVLRFSIGFGPLVWKRTIGGTEYAISLFPLGGYVKMAGEEPGEGASHRPDEFLSQPIGVRARIIAAGPLVNAAVSVLTLWVVLVTGYPELLPVIGKLVDEMPAQVAGLQTGDQIQAVNGQPIRTWDELTQRVQRAAGEPLAVQLTRNHEPLTLTVTPKPREITDPFGRMRRVGLIGVSPSGEFTTYRVSPIEAVGKTIQKEGEWLGQIGLSLWSLATGKVSAKDSLTGPIGIMYIASEAAQMGFGSLLYLVSLFSLSLAVFNFFPVPILDGGHLFFLLIEKLRGNPVSMRVQEKAAQVSMALLLALVVMVCFNDLSRFGLIDKIRGLWTPN
jgi:regulator of sigma E protease